MAQTSKPSAGPVLEVTGLTVELGTKRRSRRVVDDVSFGLGPGETLGLVGESGSGKSMTAYAIMGLLRRLPVASLSGSVRLHGYELTGLARGEMRRIRGQQIAMVMQDPMSSLNPAYTVGQQIVQTIKAHRRVSHREAFSRAIEVLKMTEIPAAAQRVHLYPHELSGGMRQRVMLAMALACEPAVLIADEPTTALDVTIQAQILDLLQRLQHELGMSMLFITHDLGVVAAIGHRVAVMYDSQIIETASVDELFSNLRHPYTAELLESSPEFMPDNTDLYGVSSPTRRLPVQQVPGSGCHYLARCPYGRADQCDSKIALIETRPGDAHAVRCVRAGELQLQTPEALRSKERAW